MNYKVLIADEALADIFGLVQYIHTELCNPDAINLIKVMSPD